MFNSQLMSSEAKANLQDRGWATITCEDASDDQITTAVKTMAGRLGTPVADRGSDIFQALKPTTPKQAHPSSLSAQFGTGELPLHMDTAHWTTPCRYVVLACLEPGPSPTPTYLYDCMTSPFDNNETRVLREGLFHVKNGRKSFYSSVVSSMRSYFRFDPGCMFPMNDAAKDAAHVFTQKLENSIKFHWRRGALLVLDNWRVLHGRGEAHGDEGGRILLRSLVV
jgi:hypothetical protein